MTSKTHGVGMNSEASSIEYELDGSIATVRLNRPEKLNAFTFAMIDQIRDAVERAAADEGVIAIVITGPVALFPQGSTPEISRARLREVCRRALAILTRTHCPRCSAICFACRSQSSRPSTASLREAASCWR